jgi:hypothetical protein
MKAYKISFMIMKFKGFRNILLKLLIKTFRLNNIKKRFFKKKEWKKNKLKKKMKMSNKTRLKQIK